MKSFLMGSLAPVWNGAGGGAGAGAGSGTGVGAGGAGDGGAGASGQAAWTPPQDLPAEFAGKDVGETFGKLFDGYKQLNTRAEGLRTQLATRPGAPATPEDYTFAPDEKLKPYFAEPDKDPILGFAKQAAHKHGISNAAFQPFIADIYGQAIEAGLIQAPYDPATEVNSYMQIAGVDKMTAQQQLLEADGFANGLAKQLKVPEAAQKDVAAALVALTDTAAGNIALRALQARLAESGIRIAGEVTPPAGPMSREQLRTLGADPRIDPANKNHPDADKRFDPDLRKRYDDGYAAIGRA